jgi:hypothetical protein
MMANEETVEMVKADGMMKVESTFTMMLFVNLTDGELADRARAMAECLRRKAEAEHEKETVTKQAKTRIAAIEDEVDEHARVVRTGKEERDIGCTLLRNDKLGIMVTIRNDDGSVISTRPQTPEEKQTNLFAIAGGAAPKRKGRRGGHAPTTTEWQDATDAAQEPEPA